MSPLRVLLAATLASGAAAALCPASAPSPPSLSCNTGAVYINPSAGVCTGTCYRACPP